MKRTFYPEPISALELFKPAPETIYSIEEAARLTQVPRSTLPSLSSASRFRSPVSEVAFPVKLEPSCLNVKV